MFSFVIPTFRDGCFAKRLAVQVRSHYPGSELWIISDGDHPYLLGEWCDRYKINYVDGDRLKIWNRGGEWLKRMYSLPFSGDYLIKLDADAYMHRPFNIIPSLGISGHITQNHWGLKFPRGGCVAYHRDSVEKILRSGLLDDSTYKDASKYTYTRYNQFAFPEETKSPNKVFHEDFCVGDIAKRLGISLSDWNDNFIEFRGDVPSNENLEYAVTHPARKIEGQKIIALSLPRSGSASLDAAFRLLGLRSVHNPSSVDQIWSCEAANDYRTVILHDEICAKFEDIKWIILKRNPIERCQSVLRYRPNSTDPISKSIAFESWAKKAHPDALVMDICDGDGWDALCPYLGVPPPSIPFPHENAVKPHYAHGVRV